MNTKNAIHFGGQPSTTKLINGENILCTARIPNLFMCQWNFYLSNPIRKRKQLCSQTMSTINTQRFPPAPRLWFPCKIFNNVSLKVFKKKQILKQENKLQIFNEKFT